MPSPRGPKRVKYGLSVGRFWLYQAIIASYAFTLLMFLKAPELWLLFVLLAAPVPLYLVIVRLGDRKSVV